jgi:hypothetical protein
MRLCKHCAKWIHFSVEQDMWLSDDAVGICDEQGHEPQTADFQLYFKDEYEVN